jgi:hypothetical protein
MLNDVQMLPKLVCPFCVFADLPICLFLSLKNRQSKSALEHEKCSVKRRDFYK